ncbi:MAG: hypothetical protein NC911_01470 [Candidatus Omnitrophica bacterium]|nr:hypothetical protein [Candidatus Omnitrophota bacterium]
MVKESKLVSPLKKTEGKLIAFLKKEDTVREKALRNCREITRLAARAIQELHQGRQESAERTIKQAFLLLKESKKILRFYPEIIYSGFLHSAEKEVVEAVVFQRCVLQKAIPCPEEFGFDPISYLHGLAESTGELRRFILDGVRKKRDFPGEMYLEMMDAIYSFLTGFFFPDALTRSLRHQIDYVRGILEKTRAEVTFLVIQSRKEQ